MSKRQKVVITITDDGKDGVDVKTEFFPPVRKNTNSAAASVAIRMIEGLKAAEELHVESESCEGKKY